ncbi:MAG: ABC-F family ATP-binding cassette domain-containing protein, partial [Chitinophagaceae bacterium]
MSILSGEQLGHQFNDNWLFKDITFGIPKGQRVALVGINGSGKSTLMKILCEKIAPVEGRVVKEKGLTIGYLEQDPHFGDSKTIADYIY